MKKLSKIKLINWYTFINTTIEINNNCLVTGQNGSGKSTLLDAISYVLAAGETKFNKAADENSKRTIETYVRCKINTLEKEYLRNGDVTSYIALEFLDDKTKRIDIIGTCIEINKGFKPARIFFKITNKKIDDSIFMTNNCIKTLNQFKNNDDIEIFNQVKETQKMIASVLGINDNRYFKLLTKALAFKPIDDINEFVNKFLLEDNDINLDSLYENIDKLRQLKETIEVEEEKIKALEEIEILYEEYTELKNKEKFYDWAKRRLEKEVKQNRINELDKNIIELNNKIELEEKKMSNTMLECNNLKDTLDIYKKQNSGEKDFDIVKSLNESILNTKKEIDKTKIHYDNYKKDLELEINIDKTLDIKILKNIDDKSYENTDKTLIHYKNNLDNKKKDLETELRNYSDKKQFILQKKQLVEEKVNKLNKMQRNYSKNITLLRDKLIEELNKMHSNVSVRPVCEYIEVLDEDYRNALESYLNTQKFDLVVDERYFDEALRIYDCLKKDMNVYGTGIIDTTKIKEKEVLDNSLYNKLSISNEYVKRYLSGILGKVICVEDINDLKKYDASITKDCMVYKNRVVRKLNPKTYDEYYIGDKAIEIELEKGKKAYQEINNILKSLNDSIKDIETKLNIINKSKIIEIIDNYSISKIYLNNLSEIDRKEQELNKYKNDGILFDFIDHIEKIELEIVEKDKIINSCRNNISRFNIEIDYNIQEKNTLTENINELNKEIISDNITYEEDFVSIKNKDLEKLIHDNLTKSSKLCSSIENKQDNYRKTYSFDDVASILYVDKYLNILNYMRERELKSYKDNCNDLERKCEISFREDFINKISSYIESAQNTIKELNKNLRKHKFGKESYEFIYKPSNDPMFAKYYEIIESGKVYNSNNLFEEELGEKDKASIDELFNIITMGYSDNTIKKKIDEYTDYRKYMSYDIKVTNELGESYYFSKVSKEKSGGEIQTPCYVMIAASFDELKKNILREASFGCIVLFDEAFNKMDNTRIDALMQFYNQLNIQLIISTPPERIPSIATYVDTNLAIYKSGNTSYVISLSKEKIYGV